jgi:predicted ATP-grasp superfamily ATP-dependent carboligase
MRRERFDLVIPTTDVDTIACHRHRADLEPWGRVYTPNDEACVVLFDKHRTNKLARSVGVRTPREVVVTAADQARPALAEFGFPVVLKPRRTFDPTQPSSVPAVGKAYTEEELNRLLPELLASGPVALQENFVGHGAGVDLLLNAGEPLLAFQHARVHEPLRGGQSSYRKSVPLSPELLDASVRLLRAVCYTGVAMVELKVNPETGAWVFIEVNARFWGSLPLSVAAGADFPWALFQFLVDGRTSFPQTYRTGIYCRNLSLDLEWQLANLSADHADRTLATRPLVRVLGDALFNVLTLRERSDTFTLDDPGPGVAEVLQLARRVGSRLGRACRLTRSPAAVVTG